MRHTTTYLTIILILLQLCSSVLVAEPTTAYQAGNAAAGWLKTDAKPLGAALGQEVGNVETFTDDAGTAIYHIVYLQPSGFVIVSADNMVEPIIGFAGDGTYDPSPENPLSTFVMHDLKGRIAAVQDIQKLEGTGAMKDALSCRSKWEQLTSLAGGTGGPSITSTYPGISSVSDPRVDPLVKSQWSQGGVGTTACYNYYTPPSDPCDPCDYAIDSTAFNTPSPYGEPNNWPCGCVATAMAQLMRYHTHPNDPCGIGKQKNGIYAPSWQSAWTRGGDGFGGQYKWNLMTLVPVPSTQAPERQAIGALCYDAGVSVRMAYSPTGSSAFMSNAGYALKDPNYFDYNNTIISNPGPSMSALYTMVNPNLDYNHPVLFSLGGDPCSEEGHAVVCDGYGYNLTTLYHHINLGWGANPNPWYNLPYVEDYNNVTQCLYNIFVSGKGEIISGRVTDTAGLPVNGAAVTGVGPGGPYNTTTNSRGIYALAPLQSGKTYTISVVKSGYYFAPRSVQTGTSQDFTSTSGNIWNVNFSPGTGTPTEADIFVDWTAPGNDDGTSWYNAYNYLQDGLADPCASVIWVADGIYHPDANTADPNGTGNRSASFVLKNSLGIYGGYAGYGAADPNERDIDLYKTILSGDLNGNDVFVYELWEMPTEPTRSENSFHVVKGGFTDSTAILDGCYITAGNANGATYPDYEGGGMLNIHEANCIVNQCTFIHNSAGSSVGELGGGGGGMWNNRSHLQVSRCFFFRNTAKWGGGGILNVLSSPTIVNCSFITNETFNIPSNGGAVYNIILCDPILTNCLFHNNSSNYGGVMANGHNSNPVITNCTFSGNQASGSDSAINDHNNCNPIITNCIFWNNSSPVIGDGLNSGAIINYTDIQGGWSGAGGTGNINTDPCFVDANGPDNIAGTRDENLRLKGVSPCIDAGDNNSVPLDTTDLDGDGNVTEQTPLDLDNKPRFFDDLYTADTGNGTAPIVDMGAYELLSSDIIIDGSVNFKDFGSLAIPWMETGCGQCGGADLTCDGDVDLDDLQEFAEYWLVGID